MKTYYKRDLKNTYMIIEEEEAEKEDYQMEMLRENAILGILPVEVKHIDNTNHYCYEVSGKLSLETKYEKTKLTFTDMKQLVNDLLETMKELEKYMLQGECLLLQPEQIFCAKNRFFFCYYPANELDVKEEFHRLTEFFVRQVDYQDKEGVHMAYTIHKATMEENYSLIQIMEDILIEEVVPTLRYDEKTEPETILIREESPTDFWQPVKRLLERKKKEKWGSWNELLVEEQDL